MKKPHFRFSTDILKRLGEELNPDPDQSILELIKNAYDADARKCLVLIDSKNGGSIKVVDNGDGMTREQIVDAWLLVGRSSKRANQTTRLGRSPAGNKGLGRLAALRMGNNVSLTTRSHSDPGTQLTLEIDWSLFDRASTVENVELEITRSKSPNPPRSGTSITLTNLRNKLSETDIRRIIRGFLLLADPFGDDPTGFKPILRVPGFKKLEKLVRRRYFDDAELKLTAEIHEDGLASASILDWQGRVLFTAEHKDLRPKFPDRRYKSPPAKFDLWTFVLDAQHFSTRESTMTEVRTWLKEFGGVHLYIRGLRILPYGNPGNDWLDMNLLRGRSPELRPGTNTSIGRITTQDPDEKFFPKTDRTGIAENETFLELQAFAIDALNWMARRRVEERDRRQENQAKAAAKETQKREETVNQIIGFLPREKQEDLRKQLLLLDRAKDRQADLLRRQLQLYRLLGTAGITASVFAHDTKHSVDIIRRNSTAIASLWKKHVQSELPSDLQGCIDRIRNQTEALQTFGGMTLSFLSRDKRRLGRVEVHHVIAEVVDLLEPLFRERKVQIKTTLFDGNPYLRASEANIQSVIANLVVNSLKVFEGRTFGERLIEIRSHLSDEDLVVEVSDTGPGIQGNLRDIWLPGETSYTDGTGLGLTIVRDTVKELGGSVFAHANGDLGGEPRSCSDYQY